MDTTDTKLQLTVCIHGDVCALQSITMWVYVHACINPYNKLVIVRATLVPHEITINNKNHLLSRHRITLVQ